MSWWHQSVYRYVSHFVFVKADLWPSCLSFLFVSFLQLSLRDNDLISLPKEIGELAHLKELHIQGNRLTVLPPELGIYATASPRFSFLHFHLFSSSTLVQQQSVSESEHKYLGSNEDYICVLLLQVIWTWPAQNRCSKLRTTPGWLPSQTSSSLESPMFLNMFARRPISSK